jgi:hypothetical protein
MLFKNPVRTSKRTPHFTITKINWLTLFKEIIAVYSEIHRKPINAKHNVTNSKNMWYTYLPFVFKGLDAIHAFSFFIFLGEGCQFLGVMAKLFLPLQICSAVQCSAVQCFTNHNVILFYFEGQCFILQLTNL